MPSISGPDSCAHTTTQRAKSHFPFPLSGLKSNLRCRPPGGSRLTSRMWSNHLRRHAASLAQLNTWKGPGGQRRGHSRGQGGGCTMCSMKHLGHARRAQTATPGDARSPLHIAGIGSSCTLQASAALAHYRQAADGATHPQTRAWACTQSRGCPRSQPARAISRLARCATLAPLAAPAQAPDNQRSDLALQALR